MKKQKGISKQLTKEELQKMLKENSSALKQMKSELEVEAALERVRARAMAMQKSDELAEAAELLYHEFGKLGINTFTCGYLFVDETKNIQTAWVVLPDGKLLPDFIDFPLTGDRVMDERYKAWKEKIPLHICEIKGEENKAHHRFLSNHVPPFVVKDIFSKIPERIIFYCANFSNGYLFILSTEFFSPKDEQTIIRFAKVFDLTYTRFLDLQKAEAQTREAQIELGLERVRARAMAMQKSEDLNSVVATVFEELGKLNLGVLRCGIGIFNKEKKTGNVWSTSLSSQGRALQISGDESFDIHPLLQGTFNAWLEQKDFSYTLEGEDYTEYYKAIAKTNFNLPESKSVVQETVPLKQYYYTPTFQAGNLYSFCESPFSEDAKKIMNRFSGVLNLTYNRFLDLKKAEAQTREAQIELGLERVRARTMAMHKSDELAETTEVLHQQMIDLGIKADRTLIAFPDGTSGRGEFWSTNQGGAKINQKFTANMDEPYQAAPTFTGWKQKLNSIVITLEGQELLSLLNFYKQTIRLPFSHEISPAKRYYTSAYFSHGWITVITSEPLSDENINTLERFASVFNLTYTRFLDLQKAEAQTREAQIEAVLERVRARTMAMHKSEELHEVNTVIIQQIKVLSIRLYAFGIHICHVDEPISEAWMGDPVGGYMPKVIYDHSYDPLSVRMYAGWKEGKILIEEKLSGDALKEHFNYMITLVPDRSIFDNMVAPESLVFHFAYFKYGFFVFLTQDLCPEEHSFFKRLAKVFEQTYTRFLDLQKAEVQAKEAIKQASLDRIRGHIASMRSAEDLQRITPLVWQQLTTLNVPFVRCGVFIVDEVTASAQAYLSTPDGRSLGVLTIPFNSEFLKRAIDNWRKNVVHLEHWDREQFVTWMKSMIQTGQIQDAETYQGSATPPESLNLHFVPFKQGMLYVGNINQLKEEEINLVKSLAEAFSIAYARYEDFKKLEHAKQSIESTLTELKATQTQLIQSEKMASLGELTAGIAHEIQNPLNFVNNFSEVNTELIEEMKQEINKGNIEEIKNLANDIEQNEQKINYHGKRADAIVKGMLQHSRSSTGKKEPTDINALADEYLRLAYHGLRAKDKSFNATMKTDFDESIGNINIMPQDIGRVILNLITNAFYAVTEKKRRQDLEGFQNLQGLNNYEPTVSVSTKKINGKVEIRVADNGNGIPQKVLDKIFQPFFTTKPAGQGTGLGLSLSYDIIKAHGGDLKVENKEGEGADFIIQLPI